MPEPLLPLDVDSCNLGPQATAPRLRLETPEFLEQKAVIQTLLKLLCMKEALAAWPPSLGGELLSPGSQKCTALN